MRYTITIVLFTICSTAIAQQIEVVLKNNGPLEAEGKIQLERIVKIYNDKISPWLFTKKFVIDKATIPFSHPVLTLNTRYLKEDTKQLSTLLHEEFHWFVEDKPVDEKKAIESFKQLFPAVPSKGREGARDEYSTYLHLIVCDLEFQAMTTVIGENNARDILSQWTHYTWIYDKVLNDKRVREVNVKNGFVVP